MKQKPLKKQSIPSKPIQKKSGFGKNNIYILVILLLTAIVYFRTLQSDFTNWDDDMYLKENPYIKNFSAKGIADIFSESYFGNYHPITTLSYALEYKFFGLNPGIYHFNNLLFHLINTFLVFLLIKKLSKRIEVPLITAFLFALHPMHVESVAWVSERKDVLYTMFLLISLIFYIKYLKNNHNIKLLFISFLLFSGALMSKSAAIITPALMLLTAYYINKKLSIKEILHSLPFFALSLLFGIILLNTQVEAISKLNELYPGINRILIVTFAVYYYIVRFIAPFNMTALHAFPSLTDGKLPLEYYVAPAVLVAIVLLCIFSKKEFRFQLIFGLLFYIISVALIIQVMPVGQAVVAERYTYLPYIGLAFISAQGFILLQKYVSPNILYFLIAAYAVFLMASTWQQIAVWKNSELLWTKVLDVYPENQIAYNNRGLFRTENNRVNEAFDDFNKLIEINPNYEDVYNNRATACFKMKDYGCVVRDLSEAITRKPDVAKLYNNRGLAKSHLLDMKGADEDYTKAIELDSMYIDAYTNRVNAREALNDYQGAVSDLNFLIQNSPNASLYNIRGIIYGKTNNFNLALTDFEKAITLDNTMSEVHINKGIALLNMGNKTEACSSWQKALNMGNTNSNNWLNLYCK